MTENKKGTIEIKSGDEAIDAFNAMLGRLERGETQLVDFGFSDEEDLSSDLETVYGIILDEWKARGKKAKDQLGLAAYMLSEIMGIEWTEDEPT